MAALGWSGVCFALILFAFLHSFTSCLSPKPGSHHTLLSSALVLVQHGQPAVLSWQKLDII